MGVSTDGQICFGIAFNEEGATFPWDSDEYDGDIEDWWIYAVQGYQRPFEIFDADGEYLEGICPSRERIAEYYQLWHDFKESRPALPIALVLHCSYDFPMYILAVPRTVKVASRGYPEEITPSEMVITQEERDLLVNFCEEHNIEAEDKPRWWLSSMWG